MEKPEALPSTACGTDNLFDRPARRARQVIVCSVLLGVLCGLGEGLIDLTFQHVYPPTILCVTVIANLMVFLVIGLLFWILGLGLSPQRGHFLVLFVMLWTLLHDLEREFTQDANRGLLWLLSLMGTCFAAVLFSLWAWRHGQKIARISGLALPWIVGTLLASLAALPLYPIVMHQRAIPIATQAAESSPNVILIIVDTLRADHLSSYHYGRLTSPNLDQLAVNGVLFENAIATSSWTLPSHASMLTGLYPNQHHAQEFHDQLGAEVPTIAEELERAGYRTGAFSGSPFFTPRQGLGRGFGDFGDFSFTPTQAFIQVRYVSAVLREMGMTAWVNENIGQPSAIKINESVIQWIDSTHQPFFLAVNYFEVRQPNWVPKPLRRRFSVGQRSEKRISSRSMLPASQFPEQFQGQIDEYDSAIAYVDDGLQKLVNELGRRRLMDNTLLIVTADHGEGLGEHGLLTHGTALYYPLVHVPLIFYWPQHLPEGLRIQRPVSAKDIPATILELLGVSHSRLPGKSLAALWNGQKTVDQWPMPVSELVRERQFFGRSSNIHADIASIVSSELQLILDSREGPMLYNWQTDPQERDNLFLSPRYVAVAGELAAELKSSQ